MLITAFLSEKVQQQIDELKYQGNTVNLLWLEEEKKVGEEVDHG